MAGLYKIQIREQEHAPFRDYVDWCPCAESITKLREIFRDHPEWELRVMDERDTVVVSTLDQSNPPTQSWNFPT